MIFVLLYHRSSLLLIYEMVLTRSRARARADANNSGSHSSTTSSKNVKILTSSFREASVKSYKIYNGSNLKSTRSSSPNKELFEAHVAEAAQVLTEMKTTNKYSCMNPMHPVTKYMYRMQVFNSSRTRHYNTAFIGYNNKTRMYYIHTIISNCYPETNDDTTTLTNELPLPVNTLQTKYSSYTIESIENYVMTILVPSREYDYYIQDDIIGILTTDNEFCNAIFGEDSSYYDVEGLLHDESSNETINGFKSFLLIPSRNYWFDPFAVETRSSAYSGLIIYSILNILCQSQ